MIAKPHSTVIEGTWEEVSRRSKELAGRRVRVIVLEEAPPASTREAALKWLEETETLVREPRRTPPTEFEQMLIEKMRKQGIEVE